MTDNALAKKTPLEDLMVAMDVVDTLRHQDRLVDRELDSEGRRERLIEQLREIYTSQGISVSDAVLEEGVLALEEDRFSYKPAPAGISTSLAKLYVGRKNWLGPLLSLFGLVAVIGFAYYLLELRPEQQQLSAIPETLEQRYQNVIKVAVEPEAAERAQLIRAEAQQAISRQEYDKAEGLSNALDAQLLQLNSSYSVRVLNQPGQKSGIWRMPDFNPNAKNYYVIVEGINALGNAVDVNITDEETGERKQVKRWGVRVEQSVYQQIAADKSDDGIIQNSIVGKKVRGYSMPSYTISTTGAAITEW